MTLLNQKALTALSNRVLIGNSETIPNEINAIDKELWTRFAQTDKKFEKINTLETSIFLIRFESQPEKMREYGARVRVELDKEAESLEIFASTDYGFEFLEGFLLRSYAFLKYFTDKQKREYKLTTVTLGKKFDENVLLELTNIQKAVFWARDMVNEPVSFLNAEQLANEIAHLGTVTNLNVNVLEKSQIEALKMGGLLAVNQGSIDPPTFTIIEYKPKKQINKKPIVLVGKGVVYDTGGLSLKPTPNSMDLMKSDMGGAACMAGAMFLIALQELPVHVIGLIPATDNRPGLNAYAPGDVVKMYNGSTVEVLNTDAEGRMILADALSYANKYDPELVIDAATLTGAAQKAIGSHASIVMGNAGNQMFDDLETAGNQVHERLVKFPFWDDYFEEMKSDIADLKNIGGPTAGMITAGKFLEKFVQAPYIHIDIAGPAWLDKNEAYRTKGGSGVGVRLIYQFFKNMK